MNYTFKRYHFFIFILVIVHYSCAMELEISEKPTLKQSVALQSSLKSKRLFEGALEKGWKPNEQWQEILQTYGISILDFNETQGKIKKLKEEAQKSFENATNIVSEYSSQNFEPKNNIGAVCQRAVEVYIRAADCYFNLIDLFNEDEDKKEFVEHIITIKNKIQELESARGRLLVNSEQILFIPASSNFWKNYRILVDKYPQWMKSSIIYDQHLKKLGKYRTTSFGSQFKESINSNISSKTTKSSLLQQVFTKNK
ncbi:MAG: hypothetical protein AB7R69_05435 [Candidatus Babeliales bacterium]